LSTGISMHWIGVTVHRTGSTYHTGSKLPQIRHQGKR